MGRVYHRDRLGRFAPKGFSGQTGGRGARLMGPGKQRAGGGQRISGDAAKRSGTLSATRRSSSNASLSNQQKRDMKSRQVQLERSLSR